MRMLFALAGLVGLVTATGCDYWGVSVVRLEEYSTPVPTEKLVVSSSNGEISVLGTETDEILILAKIEASGRNEESAEAAAEEVEILIQETDNVVSVEAVLPSRFRGAVGFSIEVPRSLAVELSASNGRLQVDSIDAAMKLKTSNGRVQVQDAGGNVEAETSNGQIEVQSRVPVTVNLDSGNGAISFQGGLRGETNQISTRNGRVTVGLWGPATSVQASSGNGSIRIGEQSFQDKATELVGGGDGPEAAVKVKTSNGAIRVESIEPPSASPAEDAPEAPSVETGPSDQPKADSASA